MQETANYTSSPGTVRVTAVLEFPACHVRKALQTPQGARCLVLGTGQFYVPTWLGYDA